MSSLLRPRRRHHLLAAGVLSTALLATACSATGPEPDPSATSVSGSPSPTADGTEDATEGGAETPSDGPSTVDVPSEATESDGPSDGAFDRDASHAAIAAKHDLPPMPEIVRGAYTHPHNFWHAKWDTLVSHVAETELNALVIDVKDEAGVMLFEVDHPFADAVDLAGPADRAAFQERFQKLKDAGGWAIARISCFKDTKVARAHPEVAIQDASGNPWVARKDFSWLNPYSPEAGQWCIDIATAAVQMGFDEIQFDYIRFPNGGDGDVTQARFPGMPSDVPQDQYSQPDAIIDFLTRASEQIHEAGGWFSVDLFGLVTYNFSWNVDTTGQVLERIAEVADVISLMVYPSHYGPGNYGLTPHPGQYPYETVWNAMQEAQMRTQGLHAKLRPWLEAFTLGHAPLTPKHITEQMRAAYENGIDGWLLWNAANSYPREALQDTLTSHANADFRPPARTAVPDAPPGEDQETQWPGRPPCDPYPGVLFIGERNLAGSLPPELALPHDDPRLCAGVADGEEAEQTWQEREAAGVKPGDAPRGDDPTEDMTTEPSSAPSDDGA